MLTLLKFDDEGNGGNFKGFDERDFGNFKGLDERNSGNTKARHSEGAGPNVKMNGHKSMNGTGRGFVHVSFLPIISNEATY